MTEHALKIIHEKDQQIAVLEHALKEAVKALEMGLNCQCSLLERDSGHSVICYVPKYEKVLESVRRVLS